MEFNGLLILAAVWFLLSLIGKAQRKLQGHQRPQPPEPMRPRHLPQTQDATQVEGSRLELVLRELQRSLEGAAGPPIQFPAPEPPEAEEVEAASLETEPEIRSLEEEVRREVRRRVVQDDDAADIEVRRIRAAAARDTPHERRDRTAAQAVAQQQPADHTAARTYTTQQLRDAVIWREILAPPVSMRRE
jgi:hypothetical protein